MKTKINKSSKINFQNLILGLALVSSLLFVTSCSESINGVPNLPYTEQLVIRGVLEAGKPVKGISITRTLPPLDTFSLSKMEIQNVNAVITCDNISYPLKYAGNTLYDTDTLIAQSGKTYEIIVKWNGKTAYGFTTVPSPVDFDSIQKEPATQRRRSSMWTFRLSAEVKLLNDVAIVGGFELDDSLGKESDIKNYTSRVYHMADANTLGKVSPIVFVQTVADTNIILYDSASFKLSFFVEAYDIQFYEYFRTRTSGESPNSTFGLSGSNIHWNIKGDGVGLFIGYASTKKRFLGLH